MKYVLEATVNYETEEQTIRRIESDANLAGISLTDILEQHPRATSLVLTVVRKLD